MDVSILVGSCRRCCCPCRCHPFAPKQDLFYMVFMPLHLQMSHFKTNRPKVFFLTNHQPNTSEKHQPNTSPKQNSLDKLSRTNNPPRERTSSDADSVVGDGSTSTQVRIHKVGFWGKRRQLHCIIGLVRVG